MVSKVSDDSYRVDRDILELYANDYELLGRLGWVRAHEDERGRRDGFTIRGIRCGTLLQQVGLKNRDTIHSVNGKPVRNLFGALAAYRKFKRDDVVELQITRLGETELITYHMH
jgi:S1-C subfamily serine protease